VSSNCFYLALEIVCSKRSQLSRVVGFEHPILTGRRTSVMSAIEPSWQDALIP
jgi:hypothetical protein